MADEIAASIIGASAALIGAALGGVAAWKAASTTNTLQAGIAAAGASLQQRMAADNAAFQAELATNNLKFQARVQLDSSIQKINEISITYPYLESNRFCNKYPNIEEVDELERYENYCTMVFNMLNEAWRLCGGNATAVRDIISDEELVRRHHCYWLTDVDNLSYEVDFRNYIQLVIDDLRMRGAVK